MTIKLTLNAQTLSESQTISGFSFVASPSSTAPGARSANTPFASAALTAAISPSTA
jgi:hypothetical protein